MSRIFLFAVTAAAAVFAQCNLTPGTGLNLGPTAAGRLRATGEIRMAFMFVDFQDAPGNEDVRQLFQQLVPYAQQWVDEVSYGRARLTVQPIYQWFRMVRLSSEYNFARGLTFERHRAYIADAIRAVDPSIDFSQYDGIYILASRDAQIPFSPTWVPNPGQGLTVDGVDLRHVITLGADVRQAIPNNVWHVITHETGHLWGLPDLYLFTGAGMDVHNPVSGWDNMGWIRLGAHFTSWQKRKLGWLRPEEFECVTARSRYVELSPLAGPTGIRGLAVQTSPERAVVAEVRRPLGHDSRLCDQGLLVYTVNSQVASGSGPLVVQRAAPDQGATRIQQCGPAHAATYNVTGDKPSIFRDSASGVTIEILNTTPNGGMQLRVTNPGGTAVPNAPAIASVAGAGAFGARRSISPGSWIELFGTNLAPNTRSWASADFTGPAAPQSLDNVRLFVAGRPAYVSYISPTQINAQVPDGIGVGNVPVLLTNGGLLSNQVEVEATLRSPGMLSPPAFNGYVVAVLPDGAFAGPPGLIAGANFRRARAGETIIVYGVGFGVTTPPVSAGIIVDRAVPLPNPVVTIAGARANASFAGLAPGLIGLYQFNVLVPDGIAGDVLISIQAGGVEAQQGLRLALQ